MGKKVFVGNLSVRTTSAHLEVQFSKVGIGESESVVTERDTGRSRGFGFVETGSSDEAQKATAASNGRDVQGGQLNVSEAKSVAGAVSPAAAIADGGTCVAAMTHPAHRGAGRGRR